jgi:glycosyltransferase involved in cell wall biosynthesis
MASPRRAWPPATLRDQRPSAVYDVVKKSLKLNLPVFVVDDGSTDSSYEKIRNYTGIYHLRHTENRGKGAAIITGFTEAEKIADWAITIDADGQHDPQDALPMMEAIHENERPLVVGMRHVGMVGKKVPGTSRMGKTSRYRSAGQCQLCTRQRKDFPFSSTY